MRKEQHQRRGRHAIEARRLTETRRLVPLELLADLVGEARERIEGEAIRDGDGFLFAEGRDVHLLAGDVDGVARVRCQLAGNGSLKLGDLRPDLREPSEIDFRIAEEIEGAAVSYTH